MEHPPIGTVIVDGRDMGIGLFVTVIEYLTRDVYRADIPDYDFTMSYEYVDGLIFWPIPTLNPPLKSPK